MTQNSTDQVQDFKAAQDAADTKTTILESLSALIDNEASEMEVHRLLKHAESDPEIRESWRRYQLVRSVLKGDPDINPHIDLSQRISAAIGQEIFLQTPGRLKPGLLKPWNTKWGNTVGKAAIAASVTFAFILGVQQFTPQGQQVPAQVADSSDSSDSSERSSVEPVGLPDRVPTGFELPPFAARTVSTDAGTQGNAISSPQRYSQAVREAQLQNKQALQNYFDHLLLKHAERSSSNGSMGLIPFARVSRMDAARE